MIWKIAMAMKKVMVLSYSRKSNMIPFLINNNSSMMNRKVKETWRPHHFTVKTQVSWRLKGQENHHKKEGWQALPDILLTLSKWKWLTRSLTHWDLLPSISKNWTKSKNLLKNEIHTNQYTNFHLIQKFESLRRKIIVFLSQ